jgi:hypothetical protein
MRELVIHVLRVRAPFQVARYVVGATAVNVASVAVFTAGAHESLKYELVDVPTALAAATQRDVQVAARVVLRRHDARLALPALRTSALPIPGPHTAEVAHFVERVSVNRAPLFGLWYARHRSDLLYRLGHWLAAFQGVAGHLFYVAHVGQS